MIIQNTSAVQSLLSGMDALPAAIKTSMEDASESLRSLLKQEIERNLSGQVLQSKSGRLKNSITDIQSESETEISAILATDNVPYAEILEYGGLTKAHIIQATQAKVLAFTGNGKQMFLPYILHPGSQVPEFAYMRTALASLKQTISDALTQAVAQSLASL